MKKMPAVPLIVVGSLISSVLFGWNSWMSLKLIGTSEDLSAVKTTVMRLDDNFNKFIVEPALEKDRMEDKLLGLVASSTNNNFPKGTNPIINNVTGQRANTL
jgi:hypothetical protein